MTVKDLEAEVAKLKEEIHSLYHAIDEINFRYADAIVAMQKKIGIDQSADPSSIDYRVSQVENIVTPSDHHALT